MQALGQIGPGAKVALPALREVAQRTGPESIAAQTILLIEGKDRAHLFLVGLGGIRELFSILTEAAFTLQVRKMSTEAPGLSGR